jgi:uncharacterized membrane protein YeaQ/YmgE (transglycosylase-associated protein family)
MFGFMSWLACGVIVGMLVNILIAGYDKGILLLTVGVGAAGAVTGGVAASAFGFGNLATVSLYAVAFAVVGSVLMLLAYTRFVES